MVKPNLPEPARIRSAPELIILLLEKCADGWLHKTKVIDRVDMAPGTGALYIDVMIQNGWLDVHRDGRLMYVTPSEAGFALMEEGRALFDKLDKTLDDLADARR